MIIQISRYQSCLSAVSLLLTSPQNSHSHKECVCSQTIKGWIKKTAKIHKYLTKTLQCNIYNCTRSKPVKCWLLNIRYLSSSKVEEYFYLAKMHIYMHLWVFLFFSKNVQLIYVMLCTIYLRQQLLHQFG